MNSFFGGDPFVDESISSDEADDDNVSLSSFNQSDSDRYVCII